MKDLKLVFLIAVPLAVVVAAVVLYDLLRGPPVPVPDRPDLPGTAPPVVPPRAGVASGRPGTTESDSAGGGTLPRPPITGLGGIKDPVLTAERAKELIARGTFDDWAELEALLRAGQVPDPLGVEAVLLAALAKGGNAAAFLDRVLPALADPVAREKAVADLFALARETAEPNALKAAFSLIGKMGSATSIEELGHLARLQERQEFFTPAIYAIATIGGAEAAAELDRLLVERVGSDSEQVVLQAIGMAGSPEMIAVLSAHLADDSPAELRIAAIRAMGLSGRPEAVAALKKVALAAAPSEVAEETILALSRIGGREAAEELVRLRKTGGALGDIAGRALGNVTGADATKVLIEVLGEEEDEQVKVQVIDALGNIRSPDALPVLRGQFVADGATSAVRGRAARALGAMGDVESLGPMLDRLGPAGDSDPALQLHVIEGIEQLTFHGGARPVLVEKAIPVLKAMVERLPENQSLRYYAIRTLNRLEVVTPRGGTPK